MTDKRKQRIAVSRPSDVELQNEYNYILAENFTKKMLEKGLVSEGEFNKIMAKNRESFSPFFARTLANITCYIEVTEQYIDYPI